MSIKKECKTKDYENNRNHSKIRYRKGDMVIYDGRYTVHLRYSPWKYDAPYVVGKYARLPHLKLNELAETNKTIVIYKNNHEEADAVCRMLYANCNISDFIPPETYASVARIYAWAYYYMGLI